MLADQELTRTGSPAEARIRTSLGDAIAIVEEQGASSLTFRSLAQRTGSSHTKAWSDFGDRVGLLAAVASAGFERLLANLLAAPADLEALALTYIDFATKHPQLHRVMHDPELWAGIAAVEAQAAADAGASPEPARDSRSLRARADRARERWLAELERARNACFAPFGHAATERARSMPGVPAGRLALMVTALADGIIRQHVDEQVMAHASPERRRAEAAALIGLALWGAGGASGRGGGTTG
ncbi:MAG: hypothetical protein SFU84_06880 [Gemmatimonadales bacterium]|nr:hypothetical protein [Gemmatimonadales bacterium]